MFFGYYVTTTQGTSSTSFELPSMFNFHMVQEFVGVIYAMGSVGTLVGVAIYHKHLRHWTFRSLLLWAQLLLALSGMLDLMLVTRLNLKLLIPDYVFAVVDEAASQVKWQSPSNFTFVQISVPPSSSSSPS